ncbi:MAG: chorismate synthase [Fimbriimonadaceae bacterium]|nr:chorismate synthase [Fimbriimonadaceae bacterium]
MSSSRGTLFRITTFGESHGGAVGVVVDGCPPRFPITASLIQEALDRRRPGQSRLTTQRRETDTVEILSGVEDGLTLGTPIMMVVRNEDARPNDYGNMQEAYRPSHAEFTYEQKYGIRAKSGGGRSSARETVGRVAAGALAEAILREKFGIEIVAWVDRVGTVESVVDPETVTREEVDATDVRCPDPGAAAKMIEAIESIRREGDSLGGTIRAVARNVPVGWGEPIFDKLEATLAKAMMSLPATKSFEVGSGLAGTLMRGSEHNDIFVADDAGRITTETNHSGGIQGGISNGMPILLRVGFKPTATISQEQATVTPSGESTTLAAKGRHDPCVLPRAVPIVEAEIASCLLDCCLIQQSRNLT